MHCEHAVSELLQQEEFVRGYHVVCYVVLTGCCCNGADPFSESGDPVEHESG